MAHALAIINGLSASAKMAAYRRRLSYQLASLCGSANRRQLAASGNAVIGAIAKRHVMARSGASQWLSWRNGRLRNGGMWRKRQLA